MDTVLATEHDQTPKPKVASPPKKKAAAAPAPEGPLEKISDDLTTSLSAWSGQAERVYGDAPPIAELTVTILAATGLSKTVQEPFWLASVAGEADETGTSAQLDAPLLQAPAGAPSWQADPLTLVVHDVTSDLLLLLCESAGTDAARACVGRAVIPLTELLPPIPFLLQPEPRQLWVDIFPPASEAAPLTVAPRLEASWLSVDTSGMEKPAQQGRVLVRVMLSLKRSLVGAYLRDPPFDPSAGITRGLSGGRSDGPRANRPTVTAERLQVTAARVHALTRVSVPACVRLAGRRPWSSGGALVFLAGWLCFFGSAAMLPCAPRNPRAASMLACHGMPPARATRLPPATVHATSAPPPRRQVVAPRRLGAQRVLSACTARAAVAVVPPVRSGGRGASPGRSQCRTCSQCRAAQIEVGRAADGRGPAADAARQIR